MLPFRIISPRLGFRIHPIPSRASTSPQLTCLFRQSVRKSLQARCYAKPASKPTRVEEELMRQARAAAKSGKKHELPQRLIIYHAGTGRTTFLAMVKITTLFMGAFFCCIVVPSYVKAEKPEWETAGVALCGIIPILFVAYTTSPFVTHIHIHLPPYARTSKAILERYVKASPANADLTFTTMSAIAKPRYSNLKAGNLVPTQKRFGLINYVRDTAEENAKRKWYNFRAVGKFYVQERSSVKVRYAKKKDMVDGWIWDAIKEKVGKNAGVAF